VVRRGQLMPMSSGVFAPFPRRRLWRRPVAAAATLPRPRQVRCTSSRGRREGSVRQAGPAQRGQAGLEPRRAPESRPAAPGDPERRERRHQALRRCACLLQPPEFDQARHQKDVADVEVGVRLYRPQGVFRRRLGLAGEEMGEGECDLKRSGSNGLSRSAYLPRCADGRSAAAMAPQGARHPERQAGLR
jgi:hypothetical protein